MKQKIIVSGSEGQLGRSLQKHPFLSDKYDCFFLSKKELDITDLGNLKEQFNNINPAYFVNTAAYTAVDQAETDIKKCFLINDYSLKYISDLCKSNQCKLIHVSSDYVYHLDTDQPLKEDAPTLPRGIYAQSKLAGEQKIISSGCEYSILRTSWVYASSGRNFIKTVIRLANERETMNVVNDQIGTLTYAEDLADVIFKLLQNNQEQTWNQIYNYSNEGKTNWFEIASFIVDHLKLSMQVKPIPTSEYPTPCERPKWSVMDKSKIKSNLGLSIPNWELSLKKCLKELMVS